MGREKRGAKQKGRQRPSASVKRNAQADRDEDLYYTESAAPAKALSRVQFAHGTQIDSANTYVVPKLDVAAKEARQIADIAEKLSSGQGKIETFHPGVRAAKNVAARDAARTAAYDIWGEAPPAVGSPSSAFGGKSAMTYRPRAPVGAGAARVFAPDGATLVTAQAVELPGTALSYNPTFQAQQDALRETVDRIIADEEKDRDMRSKTAQPRDEVGFRARAAVDLLEFAEKLSKEKAEMEARKAQRAREAQGATGLTAAGDALEATSGETLEQASAASAPARTMEKKKYLRREMAKFEEKLKQVEREIQEEERREFLERLRASPDEVLESLRPAPINTDPDRPRPRLKYHLPKRFIHQMRVPLPYSDVALTEDIRGSLRQMHPEGNLLADRHYSIATRNIISLAKPSRPKAPSLHMSYRPIRK